MIAAKELSLDVGLVRACTALAVSRASVYRLFQPKSLYTPPKSHRALSLAEQQVVLDTLNSPRFVDKAPAEVVATLLDEGIYLCSTSTMYRLLRAHRQVRERRDLLHHPQYTKPELLATQPGH